MDNFTPTIDDPYREYADLLLRHHQLLSEGQEESAEAAEVEGELTALWERLDPVQRTSLNGLASDLNWVRRRGAPAPRGRRPEGVSDEDIQRLDRAQNDADWHAMLHHLRVCAPRTPTPVLAQLRARAWANVGLSHVAAMFRDFVPSSEPADVESP